MAISRLRLNLMPYRPTSGLSTRPLVFITVKMRLPAMPWQMPTKLMLTRNQTGVANTCIHFGRKEPIPQEVIVSYADHYHAVY
ncbi:hypothetical protein TYRP_016263 [Tyrophagus putrescentiae]|nr:hypothetical protein TYRP_016263 [Tyrophagus putrescentiae]